MDDKELEDLLVKLEDRVRPKQSAMERHAQTVLAAVIVLLIGWVGMSITTMKDQQGELVTGQALSNLKIENLTENLEEQQKNYVRQVDFLAFKNQVERRLQELEK